jgi:hypothetical protein
VVVNQPKKREIAKMGWVNDEFYGISQKMKYQKYDKKHYTVKKHTQIFQPKIFSTYKNVPYKGNKYF